MKEIIAVHHPKIKTSLVQEALEMFFELREIPGLKKKPSTSELIDWLKLLMADDIPEDISHQSRSDEGDSAAVWCVA